MGTEIKTWQIIDGKLNSISTSLKSEGRSEPYDLEPWLASNPAIIGEDIVIIGRQVKTKSGPIDLLAIDMSGNTVIIELKRDHVPREALAQAIDYASDVSTWSIDKISEICASYLHKSLEDIFNDKFPDVDLEELNINTTQRIILVGFSIEASLERMIEWLSDVYHVNINAIVLNYIRTANGEELLTKTAMISEEIEQERVNKRYTDHFTSFCKNIYEDIVQTMDKQLVPEKKNRRAWKDKHGSKGFSMWYRNSFLDNSGGCYFLYFYEADPDIKTHGKISIALSVSRKNLLDRNIPQIKIDKLEMFLKSYKPDEFTYDVFGCSFYIEKYFEKLDYSDGQRYKISEALKSLIENTKQKVEEILT